jgi:hypothetical protein
MIIQSNEASTRIVQRKYEVVRRVSKVESAATATTAAAAALACT